MLIAILIHTLCSNRLKALPVVGIALLIGGGFSNWIDRLHHGNVVIDFMKHGHRSPRTGIFNVADLFIVGGTLILAYSPLRDILPNHPKTP